MFTHGWILGISGAALIAMGCGGAAGEKPKTSAAASKSTQAAVSSKSALTAQKPADATQTTTPPKPIPQARSAGSTTVKPPEPSTTQQSETWAFTNVDIDGDGEAESGVVMVDPSQDLMLAWWSDQDDLDGDGVDEAYDAMVWVMKADSGVIIDLGPHGEVACVSGGTSACVVCDASGECSQSDS